MFDPVTTAAAAAVARRTIPGVSEDDRPALDAMVELVRQRLPSTPGTGRTIIRAQARPNDDDRLLMLELIIAGACERDPLFAERLRQLHGQLPATVRDNRGTPSRGATHRAHVRVHAHTSTPPAACHDPAPNRAPPAA